MWEEGALLLVGRQDFILHIEKINLILVALHMSLLNLFTLICVILDFEPRNGRIYTLLVSFSSSFLSFSNVLFKYFLISLSMIFSGNLFRFRVSFSSEIFS